MSDEELFDLCTFNPETTPVVTTLIEQVTLILQPYTTHNNPEPIDEYVEFDLLEKISLMIDWLISSYQISYLRGPTFPDDVDETVHVVDVLLLSGKRLYHYFLANPIGEAAIRRVRPFQGGLLLLIERFDNAKPHHSCL